MKKEYFIPSAETISKSRFISAYMQYSILLITDSSHCPGQSCNGDTSGDISSGHAQFDACFAHPPSPGLTVTINCLNGESLQETFDQIAPSTHPITCEPGASSFTISTAISPVPSSDCVVVDILVGPNDKCEDPCNG